jgi:hypothetical protein
LAKRREDFKSEHELNIYTDGFQDGYDQAYIEYKKILRARMKMKGYTEEEVGKLLQEY